MSPANLGAVRPLLLAAAVLASSLPLSAQVVEKGRTYDELVAVHPCDAGLSGRLARITDAQSSSSIGGGGGSTQAWAVCDGVDTWTLTTIGGGGLPGAGEVTEAMLKAVDTANDEEYLTYETTTGDFEWQALSAIGGSTGATDNILLRSDGTGAATLQASPLSLSDVSGVTTTLATITPAATTGATVAGQALAITASPAVASTDTAGAAAGGSVTITAGAAARNASGNANGGNITLATGAGIGTGTPGVVLIPSNGNDKFSLAFIGDENTGIYQPSADSFTFATGGAARLNIGSTITFSGAAFGNGQKAYGFANETTASTEGVGAPLSLSAVYGMRLLTNEGSGAKNYQALPTAAAGVWFRWCVQDADGLRVVANTGDTIRVIDKVTAAAGYIESTTIGSCLALTAANATEWFAESIHGVWTDGTFTYDDTGLTTP